MRFSLNFIREFLKVDANAQELAQRLTMAGMEVERLEKIGKDWAFDIEVTTNRYDWLSMAGIAKEIAAVLGGKIEAKPPAVKKSPLLKGRIIFIEDNNDCPYYIGRAIRGVWVKESEDWLKERIINCGIQNSVNNAVDITNYCMLKWGNPLHVFDEDKIEGDIRIRRAKKGETFLGIDEKTRVLSGDNLVIADNKKVIALAGVMGAKNTEVDETTKNIFLEAAIFSPVTVRRSRRSIGLDTESSYRFERQVNPTHLEYASYEAAKLIEELAKGRLCGLIAAGRKPAVSVKRIIISIEKLNSYLGASFSKARVKKVLSRLGFDVKSASGDKITVISPAGRFDINIEADVYEEFARVQGYGEIPARIPFLTGCPKARLSFSESSSYRIKNNISARAASFGFKEIVTYSLDNCEELAKLSEKDILKVVNPLRSQEGSMRPTLLLGMIKSLKHNLNRNQSGLRFFEVADIYFKDKKGFRETPVLALGVSGDLENFFFLKRVVEEILNYFNVSSVEFRQKGIKSFTSALKITKGVEDLGFLGKLDEKFSESYGLKESLFFAQLDLLALAESGAEKKYVSLSPYPAVFRDVSLFLNKDVKFEEIERIIKEKNEYLADLRIVDTYKGKSVPHNSLAFTLRIFYRSKDRTLTSGEVDEFHNSVRNKLSGRGGVTLR